ncbi:MAG TPA: TIGR02594 family protein [Luteitalea sp.]|nr:TIGR02594 family protein [Luteitalea sp.]
MTVDTSNAPWMTVAHAELGRKVREWQGDDTFTMLLYQAVVQLRSEELGRPMSERSAQGQAREVVPLGDGDNGRDTWPVTAWCAAFVNWCLARSRAPRHGPGTAGAWLRFGTPLPAPVYGCVAVLPPDRSSGSSTGQVAFYVETKGDVVVLLGGNQGDVVSTVSAPADRVLGYRWPTSFSNALRGGRGAGG